VLPLLLALAKPPGDIPFARASAGKLRAMTAAATTVAASVMKEK